MDGFEGCTVEAPQLLASSAPISDSRCNHDLTVNMTMNVSVTMPVTVLAITIAVAVTATVTFIILYLNSP